MIKGTCKYCKKETLVTTNKSCCRRCYRRYFHKPPLKTCKKCKQMKPHHARGYCRLCYNQTFRMDKIRGDNYERYHNISAELYRKITQKCLICGFDKYVVLHHLDENHSNNSIDNMIGLCPNHHQMLHTLKYKEEINSQIRKILDDKKRFRQERLIIINEPSAPQLATNNPQLNPPFALLPT